MNTVIEITKGEWTKIMAKGKSKVLLVLVSLFAVGASIVYYIIQSQLNLTLIEGEQFSIWVLNRLMTLILPVILFMLVGDTFSGEFQEGTIKNVLSLPAKRNTLFVAKLLAIALYMLLILGIVGGISFVGTLVISGFSALTGLGSLIIAYLGAFMVLGVIEVMSALVALFLNSSSFALVLNLILWLTMGTAGVFISGLAPFLPTSYSSWYEPLIRNGNLKLMIPTLLYMISYYIILTIFGALKFQKREG